MKETITTSDLFIQDIQEPSTTASRPPCDDEDYSKACAVCHKKGKKKNQTNLCCGKCRSTYYCSKEHQKVHWRVHKLECWPLKRIPTSRPPPGEEEEDPFYTFQPYHFVASTEIKIGAIVMEEKPLVFWPTPPISDPQLARRTILQPLPEDEALLKEAHEATTSTKPLHPRITKCICCMSQVQKVQGETCQGCKLQVCSRNCPFFELLAERHGPHECDFLPLSLLPKDDPQASLPFLGPLRCLMLKTYDIAAYEQLLQMPCYVAFLEEKWLQTMLALVEDALAQKQQKEQRQQQQQQGTTNSTSSTNPWQFLPQPDLLHPHTRTGQTLTRKAAKKWLQPAPLSQTHTFTATEVAHIIGLTLFRSIPLPSDELPGPPRLGLPMHHAAALFPRTHTLKHACKPNAIVSIRMAKEGYLLEVRALQDLKVGEAVTISYVDVEGCTRLRQEELRVSKFPSLRGEEKGESSDSSKKGFLCRCGRCQDPGELGLETATVSCPVCRRRACQPGAAAGAGGAVAEEKSRPRQQALKREKEPHEEQIDWEFMRPVTTVVECEDDVDDPRRPLLLSPSSLGSSSSCTSVSYECSTCKNRLPLSEVRALEDRFREELGRVSNGGKLETPAQLDDYETLICLYRGHLFHPHHYLLQRARVKLLNALIRFASNAQEAYLRKGGVVDALSQKTALVSWDHYDERVFSVSAQVSAYIQSTHQTLNEQTTALYVGEWALAMHRHASRCRAQMMIGKKTMDNKEQKVPIVPGGESYGLEDGPSMELARKEAREMLKKAAQVFGTSHGAYFQRHIVMERLLMEALKSSARPTSAGLSTSATSSKSGSSYHPMQSISEVGDWVQLMQTQQQKGPFIDTKLAPSFLPLPQQRIDKEEKKSKEKSNKEGRVVVIETKANVKVKATRKEGLETGDVGNSGKSKME